MAWSISSARASAARPSSAETRGRERWRTALRNDSISRRKRLSGNDDRLVEGQARCEFRDGEHGRGLDDSRGRRLTVGAVDVDHEHVFAGVIDRNVLPGLEEAELAHPLRADAAGGKVGHRS